MVGMCRLVQEWHQRASSNGTVDPDQRETIRAVQLASTRYSGAVASSPQVGRNAGGQGDGIAERRKAMRWINLIVIVLFALATLIFAVQNLEAVTVSFLGFKGTAPLAVVTVLIYILGAFTGGSLLALLRRSYAGSQWSMGNS
jgi:putative membrane protein